MQALRPYQEECLGRVRDAYRGGLRRVLVSLPTGTGKTVVFASFPRFFAMKRRMLVLAHREELLEQAKQRLAEAAPEMSVAIERASLRASRDARIVVASVPTLGRAASRRLAALDPDDFYLIVVDEAHHAVADTYRRILDHFRLFDAGTPRLLVGFTATPRRGDGRALGEVFQEIVYARGLPEMIRDGWLCAVRGWRVTTAVDLDDVPVRHGDFVESRLAAVVNVAERNAAVLRAYQQLATGRRAIVFCADVAHARAMADTFQSGGVATRAVWGAMPPDERRSALAALKSGAASVLTNCNVLTEGFDEPRVDCVLMARPTRSRLLYAQMIGRGTRLHAEKSDLVVIDVVDNSREHTLTGLHTLFDLPEHLDLRGRDVLLASDRVREIARRTPWVDLGRVADLEQLEIAAERIEFFGFEPPDAIRATTRRAWHAVPGGSYALGLPGGERLLVRSSLLGTWELTLDAPGGETPLRRAPSDVAAIAFADRWVARERPDAAALVDLDAQWRRRPPSEAQTKMLVRCGIPVPKGLTRGQASWMISIVGSRRSA